LYSDPDDGLAPYLDEAAVLIAARVRNLADAAEQERPAWMTLLG
jgi:hypothetical protein